MLFKRSFFCSKSRNIFVNSFVFIGTYTSPIFITFSLESSITVVLWSKVSPFKSYKNTSSLPLIGKYVDKKQIQPVLYRRHQKQKMKIQKQIQGKGAYRLRGQERHFFYLKILENFSPPYIKRLPKSGKNLQALPSKFISSAGGSISSSEESDNSSDGDRGRHISMCDKHLWRSPCVRWLEGVVKSNAMSAIWSYSKLHMLYCIIRTTQ